MLIHSFSEVNREIRGDLFHEQDMQENPDRHNLIQDTYSVEDSMEWCPQCAHNYENKFEINYENMCLYRIK